MVYSPWGQKESDTTEPLTHTHTQFIVWSKKIHFQIVNPLDRCIPAQVKLNRISDLVSFYFLRGYVGKVRNSEEDTDLLA